MKFYWQHILFLFCFFSAKGQETMGIANSNYNPTNTLILNPASIVDSWTYLDINLIGADAYVRNNSLYLPKEDFQVIAHLRDETSTTLDEPTFNESDSKKFAYTDVVLHGPSATLSLEKFAVGLSTFVKHYNDVRNMPEPFVKFMREGLQYIPQHQIDYYFKNIRINAQTHFEVDLTLSGILKQRGNSMLTGGINIKRLWGIQSTHFNIKEVELNVLNLTDAYFRVANAQYAHAPIGFGTGKGWGADFGLLYTKYKENVGWYRPHSAFSNCEKKEYKYKIGLSLLDFGKIKYQSVYNGVIESDNYLFQRYDTTNFNGVDGSMQQIENRFANEVNNGDEYNVFLPTALSLQADFNLDNNVYLAVNAVQSTKLFQRSFGVRRGNTLAVIPRYETKFFEASMPFILHDYRYPQLGLMLRFNNIIIGSDHIVPILFRANVYAADIYFNLKIPIYKSRKCKDKKQKKSIGNSKKQKKRPDCAGYKL